MKQVDNLNHKFTKVEAEDKIEVTMTDTIMISEAPRRDIDQIAETEGSTVRTEVGLDMNKIIGEVISEVMWETLTNKIAEANIEIITGMKVMTEAGTGLQKGHFLEAIITIEIGVQAIVGPGHDQEPVWIETE